MGGASKKTQVGLVAIGGVTLACVACGIAAVVNDRYQNAAFSWARMDDWLRHERLLEMREENLTPPADCPETVCTEERAQAIDRIDRQIAELGRRVERDHRSPPNER